MGNFKEAVKGLDEKANVEIDCFVKRRHDRAMKKIEHGQSFNWTAFLVGTLACISICVIAVVLSLIVGVHFIASGLSFFGSSVSGMVTANPELGLAYQDVDEEVMMMSLMKQMSTNIDATGQFKGHFTTITDRQLEKVNLRCIDEYEYTFTYGSWRDAEELKDQRCVSYHREENATWWKCPKHNCAMREVMQDLPGQFIPETVQVTRLSAAAGGDAQ